MDEHTTYTSLATLRNLSTEYEKQMRLKHTEMTNIRNDFLMIQRQHKDITKVIKFLEKRQQDINNG